jgi:predicted RNA-binding protein YlxR (DUF448 family)
VACRRTGDKCGFIRFVRTAAGEVFCDATGRQAGRGAYLCKDARCFGRAQKGRLLDRALKVKLDAGDFERLEKEARSLCHTEDMV